MTAAAAVPPIDEVVLITTADVTGGREAELTRLFDSVEAFRANRPDVRVRHYMLLQRCGDITAGRAQIGAPDAMIVTAVDRQVPLSVARNLVLDEVLSGSLPATTLVAFPDDDAWYPAGVLEHIVGRFEAEAVLDLWFCRYGSQAQLVVQPEETPSFQTVISYGSSNTFVLRGPVLAAIGGFDETLGLGTPCKSGEDTEFMIRAHLAARETAFVNARMIGHRDFSTAVRAKYFGGSLTAIARHGSAKPAAAFALARKLVVGLALVGKRDLSVKELGGALRLASTYAKKPAPSGRPSQIRTPARAGS